MFNSLFGGDWGAPSAFPFAPPPPPPFFGAYGGGGGFPDGGWSGGGFPEGGWSGGSTSMSYGSRAGSGTSVSSSSTVTISNGVKITRTTRSERMPDGRVVTETTESTERVGGGDLGGRGVGGGLGGLPRGRGGAGPQQMSLFGRGGLW